MEEDGPKRIEFGRNVSAENAKKYGFVIQIPMDFTLEEHDPEKAPVDVQIVVKPQLEEE